MKWIGLTGGIACGKSTVAEHLRSKGWVVVDADEQAHLVLRPGESGYQAVVNYFGSIILNADRTINRSKLGVLVFSDKSKLDFLEKTIHPIVQDRVQKERLELEAQGHLVSFYDVPLLFEKNLEFQFDDIIVVACSEKVQIERLIKRNGLSIDQVRQRIAAQMSVVDKIAKANYVVYNNGTRDDLFEATEAVIKKIKSML